MRLRPLASCWGLEYRDLRLPPNVAMAVCTLGAFSVPGMWIWAWSYTTQRHFAWVGVVQIKFAWLDEKFAINVISYFLWKGEESGISMLGVEVPIGGKNSYLLKRGDSSCFPGSMKCVSCTWCAFDLARCTPFGLACNSRRRVYRWSLGSRSGSEDDFAISLQI